MPDTRFGLSFPGLDDTPDGPGALSALAADADARLHRALPCSSTTRPVLAPADDGFLIRETDTGMVRVWTGSSWADVTAAPGGAGAGDNDGWKQFHPSSSQSIPNAIDTPVAFGGATDGTLGVSRSAKGTGHEFAVNETGLYAVGVTVRYAAAAATGQRYVALLYSTGNIPVTATDTDPPSGAPATLSVHRTLQLTPTRKVYVDAFQTTGGSRVLEPGAGNGWVNINFVRVG